MNKILKLIGRSELLFSEDVIRNSKYLMEVVSNSKNSDQNANYKFSKSAAGK